MPPASHLVLICLRTGSSLGKSIGVVSLLPSTAGERFGNCRHCCMFQPVGLHVMSLTIKLLKICHGGCCFALYRQTLQQAYCTSLPLHRHNVSLTRANIRHVCLQAYGDTALCTGVLCSNSVLCVQMQLQLECSVECSTEVPPLLYPSWALLQSK